MRSMTARMAAAVVCVTGLAILLAASPAASRGASYFTGDSRGHVDVTLNKKNIQVCDDDADNRGVYTYFHWIAPTGSGTYFYVGDSNGSKSGCGSQSLSTSTGFPAGAVIYAYTYCVRQSGSMTVDYCLVGQWST